MKIAEDVEQNYLTFDGFVIIMGTDTMVPHPLLYLVNPHSLRT